MSITLEVPKYDALFSSLISNSNTNLLPPIFSAIASAVAQLQAMGFDDDDGWLTHLVEAKEGNINRVLDAIKLNQQQ